MHILLVLIAGLIINGHAAGVKTLPQAKAFLHQELHNKPVADYSHLNQ